MAIHAERTQPDVGDRGSFGKGISVGRPQLMRVGGIMRIVTRRTSDRLVNRVGHISVRGAGVLNEISEPGRRVAADALFAARAGGSARGVGVQRAAPFGIFD